MNIRSKYNISMKDSSLNLFQGFVELEATRTTMELASAITAVLDYCQYSIRQDFNVNDKTSIMKKTRKSELTKEFKAALTTLNREQKIQYYTLVMTYMRHFQNGNFNAPQKEISGMLNGIGYSRSFNIKRWKQKKLRLDMDKYLMYAQRQQKIKTYDLGNYILRRSKNKDYHCFVLEAINNIPHEKSMTVHIGFTDQQQFKSWINGVKHSVNFKIWQHYLHLYQSSGLYRSASARMLSQNGDRKMTESVVLNDNFDRKGTAQFGSKMHQKPAFMSRSMIVMGQKSQAIDKIELTDKILTEELTTSYVPPKKEQQLTQSQQKQEVFNRDLMQKIKQKQKLQEQIRQFQSKKQVRQTYVDELIEGDIFEEPDVFEDKIEDEEQESKESKKYLDLFHKLYPEYELEELETFNNFNLLHDTQHLKIYQHMLLQKRLKLLIILDRQHFSRQKVLSMLSKPETSHQFNQNIQSAQLKTFISSQNSAVMYQVNKAYNRLYRARDFIYIRHVFSLGENVYMIDKSIDHANYPPFLTIVRGSLCNVYGIFQKKENIQLIADIQIVNEGMLNPVQQTNLTLRYLKGYNRMLEKHREVNEYKFFQLDWDITKNKENQIENQIRSRKSTIVKIDKDINPNKKDENQVNRNFSKKQPANIVAEKQTKDKLSQSQEGFHKQIPERTPSPSPEPIKSVSPTPKKIEVTRFNEKTMQVVGELKGNEQTLCCTKVVNELNEQGLVIIRDRFRNHHYRLQPLAHCNKVYLKADKGTHPLWKDEWAHDDKDGGLFFIHKKKMDDQKGVLKFVLSKIAKNLVTGQSITNISLPVDIFSTDSNLQRFLIGMTAGPIVLERLENQNILTKLINIIIFGITNSLLYLNMEKPFNPILGQTFQCWINGCPAYAEQISHHPPIAALMFYGRGYEVTGQFESKVNLGVNSGTGVNDGIYKVKFKDGLQICFCTPGGEIGGLTTGDRRFNLVGKSYYWIAKANVVLEIAFDPFKKGLFSFGKQQKPADYFEGTIWQVRPEFMAKFLNGKRKEPQQKDRVNSWGKINGIWNKYICFNGKQIFTFEQDFSVILEYETHPLPSDSNWREDIEYRRRNQITRAQSEKERLETIQRKDRKLRQKFKKKK